MKFDFGFALTDLPRGFLREKGIITMSQRSLIAIGEKCYRTCGSNCANGSELCRLYRSSPGRKVLSWGQLVTFASSCGGFIAYAWRGLMDIEFSMPCPDMPNGFKIKLREGAFGLGMPIGIISLAVGGFHGISWVMGLF